jgi:hypothetical protein
VKRHNPKSEVQNPKPENRIGRPVRDFTLTFPELPQNHFAVDIPAAFGFRGFGLRISGLSQTADDRQQTQMNTDQKTR